MIQRLLLCTLAVGIASSAPAQSQSGPTQAQLNRWLERYPQADTNGDGKLSIAEARAFRKKGSGGDSGQDLQLEGAKRVVYKAVGNTELHLYIFKPDDHSTGAKAPAIVFFHGGGWANGSPRAFQRQCRYLADRGMVAMTVEYRLTSGGTLIEDCIEDAKSAMRWVRGNADRLGIDPERIASGGGSAGGHLAACVAVIDDFNAASDDFDVSAKPDAMVLFNPALALAPHETLPGERREQFENRLSRKTNSAFEDISPLHHADKAQPPCIQFFGTEDRLLIGAKAFVEVSTAAGNDSKLVTYEGAGHSFFNKREYYDLTLAEADRFFVELGWLEAQ